MVPGFLWNSWNHPRPEPAVSDLEEVGQGACGDRPPYSPHTLRRNSVCLRFSAQQGHSFVEPGGVTQDEFSLGLPPAAVVVIQRSPARTGLRFPRCQIVVSQLKKACDSQDMSPYS